MSRRRRSNGMGVLADAFGKQSRGRRRRRSGITDFAPGVGGRRRRRGRNEGLAGYLAIGDRVVESRADKRSRRNQEARIVRDAARAWSNRMSKTERLMIQEEIDETIERDHQLLSHREQQKLLQNASWVQRMVLLVRDRFRKPVL